MVESPVWGEIASAVETGAAFAGTVLGALVDLAYGVSAALLCPPALLLVVAGPAIALVPDCYLGPIFDVLVTVGILGVSTVLGALASELPAFAPAWQASLLGILEGLRGLPVERKQAVLNGFAELLQQGFADVIWGFAAGLIGGLWDEASFWFSVAYWFSGAGLLTGAAGLTGLDDPLGLLWEALSLLDAAGDAHFREEEPPSPQPAPEAPEVEVPTEPADWPTLEVWMSGLVQGFTDAVSQVWASVVEQFVVPMFEAVITEGPWALGYGVGWGVSFLVVEAVLATITVGVAEVITIGRGALAGLRAALKGRLKAMPMVIDDAQLVLRWATTRSRCCAGSLGWKD